jgi:hypothetical protein
LNFPGNYKNTPGGAFSSRVANTGGFEFFGNISGHKWRILVDLGEQISLLVVVLVIDG